MAVPSYLITFLALLSFSHSTRISIVGTDWYIDDQVTYPQAKAQGLLLNARLIQGAFDDENTTTVSRWYYPDTHKWDSERNTQEFIGNLSTYYSYGLRAFTVGMQGGGPIENEFEQNQPWIVTAFRSDGSIKPEWLSRLGSIIQRADAVGLIVILQFFYIGQDTRVLTDNDVVTAVDGATDWVLRQGYTNVLIEIVNECSRSFIHRNLRPDAIQILIKRVQDRSAGKLLVSTSFLTGAPPGPVISQADFILIHGNGLSPAGIISLVNEIRQTPEFKAKPKPIVFNEDSTNIDNCKAAVSVGASWGYYDQGISNYHDGFQSPPVDWKISTINKKDYFNLVAQLTRA